MTPYMLGDMVYEFGRFELDLTKVELRQDGRSCAVEPQVFALLAFLVEHRDRLVSKQEILENVWDGRVVSDAALASRIKSARQALGDDGRAQQFIKTVYGQGFRFVAETSTTGRAVELVSRPSIAILPFQTIGDVGPYATIAEGLPHELITELARMRWLFVVARGSSFRLRGDDVDPNDAGRVLGVRYCLTGAVEVSGKRLIVTAELVDTRDGDVVWGERYGGYVDDVHNMRAEIRSSILTALEIQIPMHEAAAARLMVTDDLDAWSAYHLGLQHIYRFNRSDNKRAAELFARAVDQDSGFARAHAGLSFVHFQNAFMRQTDDVAAETRLARQCSQRALDIDDLDPFVNFTMGRSFWLEGDLDRAQAWLERSTSLSPNFAQGIYAQAWTETMAGNYRDGRAHVDLAMRLSPLDPMFYAMAGTRGFAHMVRREDAEAAEWATRAARSPGAHVLIAMIATAAEMIAGNEKQAKTWAADVRKRNTSLTREDFFRAFPIKAEPMRTRVSNALHSLGF